MLKKIEFKTTSRGRIPGRSMRVHNKSGNKTVAFSKIISNEVHALGIYQADLLRDDETYELYVSFREDGQFKVRRNQEGQDGLIIHNSSLVEFIESEAASILRGENEANNVGMAYKELTIELSENKSRHPQRLTYRITRVLETKK